MRRTKLVDILMAETFGIFLEKYFYNNSQFDFTIERKSDCENQYKGIDLLLSSPHYKLKNVKVDEKCSFKYMNDNLPTFAFEISKIENKRLSDGWFIDSNIETEYYLLAWPSGDYTLKDKITNLIKNYLYTNEINITTFIEQNRKILPYDSFSEAEIILISKTRIFEWISTIINKDISHTKDYIIKTSNAIRASNFKRFEFSKNPYDYNGNSEKFVFHHINRYSFPNHDNYIWFTISYCGDYSCDECIQYGGAESCIDKNSGYKKYSGIRETEPINLIISKEILAQLATVHVIVEKTHNEQNTPSV